MQINKVIVGHTSNVVNNNLVRIFLSVRFIAFWENGVNVICMTADKNSPLAKMSETVLVAAASDIAISERMSEIRMSQLFIIDALCSYIRSIIYENGKDKYYKLLDIINSHSIND